MAVYFIQAGESGPIKIGSSSSPTDRLKTLQVASPERLRMLLVVDGGAHVEQALHHHFGSTRMSSEWFRPTNGLLAMIESLRAGGSTPKKDDNSPPAAAVLSDYLTRSGETATSLAKALDVSPRTIHNWCSGSTKISLLGAELIEAWTCDGVKAERWLRPEDRRRVAAIRVGER